MEIADHICSSLLILLETRSAYLLNEVNGQDKLLVPEWINHIYNALVPAKLFELNFNLRLVHGEEEMEYSVQFWYLWLGEQQNQKRLNDAYQSIKPQELVTDICMEIKNYAYQSKNTLFGLTYNN